MAESSRSFRTLAVCVVVVCCLGGAWFLLSGSDGSVPDTVQRLMSRLMGEEENPGDAAPAVSSGTSATSGTSADVSGSSAAGEAPGQVSGTVSTQPRPAAPDPHEALVSRVEQAMTSPGPALEGGASSAGPVLDTPPSPESARRSDSVVTPRFVRDMGRYLASNYAPSRREGQKGHSSVTLMQMNFRYSNSAVLRSLERDPLRSRASILDYVFTPGMLNALYRMYETPLMNEMEQAARSRRRPLSDEQIADMFAVYADRLRRLAVSLDAAAGVDLPALAAAVHRAAEREAAANDAFARAYTALVSARESGRQDEVAIQSRRMEESSRTAGMYAGRQERARNDMVYALRRKAEGNPLSSAELLFLGEWLSRRNSSPETMRAAADVCRAMASRMDERAAAENAAAQESGSEAQEKASAEAAAAPKDAAPNSAATAGTAAPAEAGPGAPAPAAPAAPGAAEPEKPGSAAESSAAESHEAAPAAGQKADSAASSAATGEPTATPAGQTAAPAPEAAKSRPAQETAKAAPSRGLLEVSGPLNRNTPPRPAAVPANGTEATSKAAAEQPANAEAPADAAKAKTETPAAVPAKAETPAATETTAPAAAPAAPATAPANADTNAPAKSQAPAGTAAEAAASETPAGTAVDATAPATPAAPAAEAAAPETPAAPEAPATPEAPASAAPASPAPETPATDPAAPAPGA